MGRTAGGLDLPPPGSRKAFKQLLKAAENGTRGVNPDSTP